MHNYNQLEWNLHNHRISIRGGMLEHFIQRPLLLNNDQAYRLLQTMFNMAAVKELEKALITETSRAVIRTAEDIDTDAKA